MRQDNNNENLKKEQQPEINIFCCFNCGHPYKANPPDSSFNFAYLTPCQETRDLQPNHNHKQYYECPYCPHRNILYWCQGHSKLM